MRQLLFALTLVGALVGCRRDDHGVVQGYVEGEYVYVGSPLAGELENLSMRIS